MIAVAAAAAPAATSADVLYKVIVVEQTHTLHFVRTSSNLVIYTSKTQIMETYQAPTIRGTGSSHLMNLPFKRTIKRLPFA